MTTHTLTATVLLALILIVIGPVSRMLSDAGEEIRAGINGQTTSEESTR